MGVGHGKLYRWYKDHLSGFTKPDSQKKLHQHDIVRSETDRKTGKPEVVRVPILKSENMGPDMCIDEKYIGGEFYTLLVNPTITTAAGGETAAQLDVAKAYFEAADYASAEKKYNEILKSNPGNADALYFGGVSSYLNGSVGFGETNFDKLAKTGFYPDGTKWYKANILLKKGKKDQAKPMLRDLINSNSMFKDRAVKVYEELYK